MDNYFPSLPDASNDVLLGLKRSLNNGPRIANSPNVSTLNPAANAANLTRLFQQYPPSSLSIPSIYQNPNLFTSANPNLSNLNHLNLNTLASGNKSLPIDRQDYLDSLNATTRDSVPSLNSNAHQLNHRRRPSLLQSAAYSNESGLQYQYIPYLSEPFRENLNRNLLARNKATLLPQHYQSLNAATNSSLINAPFNPHLAQSTPPLNFLQSNQASYSENNESNKRPRLSSIQPLLIDTVEIKKEPAYTVQVEAISPTPNEDTRADASPTKTTKDDILQQINQIDREITQTESQMSKLKRKQQEIEASNKAGKSSDPSEYLESKQQSITQVIYFENRKKAYDSQSLLEKLGPKVILPIYNQPSDTKVYHENKEKFVKFKGLLQQHFKRKLKRKQEREKYLTTTYDQMMQEWLQKLESKDSNPTKKSKDNKLREFFEKQFPELKKAREDKERLSRAGQRVRSDADLEDIMDGIQEQELEDKKIRAYAVIPPILHDSKERTYRFITNNCKIDDPVREHKELTYLNVWTDVEKEIFKEKFLQAPKNFGLIATYLENKSVMDCVQYYYSSKKRENYKQLLRKNAKKRTRALAKAQQQAAQQQAQQIQRNLARNKQLELEKENQLKTTAPLENKMMLVDMAVKDEKAVKTSTIATSIKEEPQQTESENCLTCIKCLKKIESNAKFYVINRTNCFLYNIAIEDIKRDSRLCKQCKIEFGTGECPVPSCRAVKKSNRRLKTLPREWFELTPENRYTFSAELNFPLDCKRCCTRCYLRLVRKYSSAFITSNDKNLTMKKYLNCVWEDSEIEKLKNAIRKNGRDWDVISSTQVVTKSAKQCRQFYFYFKYNLNLDELMKMTTFQTDDFDSDTCWKEIASDNQSSEDEYLIERKIVDPNLEKLQDCKKLSSSQSALKNDCDSSATISADENQINLSENDSTRITSPSKAISHQNTLLGLYNPDKLRPTSIDNQDVDSKLKITTNQKYLQQRQRFAPVSTKPPAQMPSFVKYLIDPNAPTISNNQNKLSTLRQDSPIQTSVNAAPVGSVSLPSTPLGQVFTPNPNQTQLNQQQQTSKEKDKTCVRDLIYHTIDITYQADKNSNKSSLEQQQVKDQVKSAPINQTGLPLYFPPDKIVSAGNPSALQHIISPYNLNISPLVPGIPINTNTVHLSEMDNEVQDLSKKSSKKESDYLQPKNYSLSKSKTTDYANLAAFNPSSMPPPAHLNSMNSSLNCSSRTSTPGLDVEQQQLQNFYLNNLNSLQNAARHTDSPRSRGLTPNHLTGANTSSSSQSPTPNSSRSNSSNKANQSKSTNIAPPPLIANNLINSQQHSIANQSAPSSAKGSITQGTPVHLNQQYLMNKEREASVGSITLGTPLYRSNSRSNMPKLTSTNNFLTNQNSTPFNLPSTLANTFPNAASAIINQNLPKESHLSSTQNQIMIDFNTSKQMQKRSANISDSNKERNSPLSLNRLATQYPPTIAGYPTLPLGFNPALFADAQKALELTKSQSPLLIESTKANSPKISPSPNARNQNQIYVQASNYLNQQQQSSQNKNSSSVIQTSSSQQLAGNQKTPPNVLPLYSQAHDAFQTNLLTLVNTAATQKRIEHIEGLLPSNECKKPNESGQLKEDDSKNFFNQSALKFSRNPFTQEQFDKEMKNQELIKMQKQQQLIDEHQAAIKNERNKLSKFDLDNHASRIFSDSFQKDTATTSSPNILSTSSLIDAIICRSINKPDNNKSQKDNKFNLNSMPFASAAGNNFLTEQRIKNYLNELTNSNQSSLTTQSINPLHFLHDRTLSSGLPTPSSGSKLIDDLSSDSQNWKLRKALEPKDGQRKDCGSGGKVESLIEIEPISPPSNTPTKDQQSFSGLPTSAQNDPAGFQQFFHSKIAQAMNVEQDDKEMIPKKKMKLDDELQSGDLDMKKESNKIIGLESISSLSELKAQKAEFQKQLKLSSDGEKAD